MTKAVRILIRGCIDPTWREWFGMFEINSLPDGNTLLHGEVADASALYGILARLRDLGLELISVEQL